MPKYVLSERAARQLAQIHNYTLDTFGAYQATAYDAGFDHTFTLLATFSGIGTPADELKTGFRRFRFQSHNIFYTDDGDHVLIRAVIHTSQKLRPALFR